MKRLQVFLKSPVVLIRMSSILVVFETVGKLSTFYSLVNDHPIGIFIQDGAFSSQLFCSHWQLSSGFCRILPGLPQDK